MNWGLFYPMSTNWEIWERVSGTARLTWFRVSSMRQQHRVNRSIDLQRYPNHFDSLSHLWPSPIMAGHGIAHCILLFPRSKRFQKVVLGMDWCDLRSGRHLGHLRPSRHAVKKRKYYPRCPFPIGWLIGRGVCFPPNYNR